LSHIPLESPLYHGFLVVPETYTDGWCLGLISEIDEEIGSDSGDAFVVTPDGSRADLVWEVGFGAPLEIIPPSGERWGVYVVYFDSVVRSTAELTKQFREILPQLQGIYARVTGSSATPSQTR